MHTVLMRNAHADESALQPLLTCIVCTGLRTRRPGFKVLKAGRTTVKLIMYHPSTGEFPATLKINKKGEGVSKCQGAVGLKVVFVVASCAWHYVTKTVVTYKQLVSTYNFLVSFQILLKGLVVQLAPLVGSNKVSVWGRKLQWLKCTGVLEKQTS